MNRTTNTNCSFKSQSCTALCRNPVESKTSLPNYKQKCKVSRNLMWDPRVYRGITFITAKQAEEECLKKLEECKRREKNCSTRGVIRGRGGQSCCSTFVECGYPRGGGDGDRQLTIGDLLPSYKRYLEEVDDGQDFGKKENVVTKDRGTQTDDQLLVDLQMFSLKHPCHVKVKSGIEVSTGMDKNDDLTKCLSEQLACEMSSKIFDQSMFELIQEEDMGQVARSQNCYKSYKIPIDIKRKEIEDHEQCLYAQKEKLAAILETQMDDDEEAVDALQARYFAKSFLQNLAKNAIDILEAEGFIDDTQGEFKPAANAHGDKEMGCKKAAQCFLEDVINQVSTSFQKNPKKISILIKPTEIEEDSAQDF